MKTIVQFGIIVCCFIAISAYMKAQTEYKVLMTQGVIEAQKPMEKNWIRVYPTITLPEKTSIRNSENSYAAFISDDGVLVEFEKKGVKILPATHKTKKSSSIQKISKYVGQAFQQQPAPDLMGSISRDASGKVAIEFPFDTKLLLPTVQLTWLSEAKTTNFEVRITDESGEQVMAKEVHDTTLTINLSKDIPEFKQGHCYYWSVGVAGNPNSTSSQHCLFVLNEDEAATIEQERLQVVTETNESLPSDKSALRQFVAGSWCELRNLYSDALVQYKKCAALMPSIDIYRNAPATFLGKWKQKK
ncbi:MAG: hypothetical protein JST20_13520 [Bacteroidetes bacterium]|nr:hypothetical protein [Bacteroidota bacterium]